MKRFLTFLLALLLLTLAGCSSPPSRDNEPSSPDSTPLDIPVQDEASDGKILIAYFSCTGTTRSLAQWVCEILEADLYQIEPQIPYTTEDLNYRDNDSRANKEQADSASRPAILGRVDDMASYDTVFVGYPIWHGQAPRIISTFLESYDFSGKTLVPFCTSQSSGIGSSDSNLHALAPRANWLEGRRFSAQTSKDEMAKWINELTLTTSNTEDEMELRITINGTAFAAKLNDCQAAREFYGLLPLTVEMSELNGNEKFFTLPDSLTADSSEVETISQGDLMLFGTDTLVLFYQGGSTSYSYTLLGRISNPSKLATILGSGAATVTFAAQNRVRKFDFDTKTVTLNSGYAMPIMGLGTYSLLGGECVDSVSELLQFGGRLIDTANMYHNEEAVGEAIRASNVARDEIFITTKLYPNQFSNAASAIDEALEKLGVDYIDLMLLHHPGTGDVNAYKAMEQAVADGKIRSIGLSNWYIEELEDFLPQVSIMPAVVQNEIHPYYQENDVIPYIQGLGIVVEGWYPLGGRGHTAELLGDEVICSIAQSHGVSSAQVILRWNLQKGVVVIPGSSNPEHIKENLDLFSFTLTEEQMAAINALNRDEKHDWY